jgi:hypothetical protein
MAVLFGYPFLDQAEYPAIGHAVLDELHGPLVTHVVAGSHDTLPIISTFRGE